MSGSGSADLRVVRDADVGLHDGGFAGFYGFVSLLNAFSDPLNPRSKSVDL
jgi:hypothetical protein